VVDPAFDLVADGADAFDGESGGVAQVVPVLLALAGKEGPESPQPMLITTSAARTISSVQGFGNSCVMSVRVVPLAHTSWAIWVLAVAMRRGHHQIRHPGRVGSSTSANVPVGRATRMLCAV
jgi:hypothetical protein